MKQFIKNLMTGGWAFIMVCALFVACTKYDTPDSVSAAAGRVDSTQLKVKRYVLWVNIDGARGSIVKQEVEKENLPTLKSMLQHSKYAWTGLADDHSTLNGKRGNFQEEDPVTWASMLTGVSSSLHKVNSYSYTPEFDVDDGADKSNAASYFPNIAQVITSKDPAINMSCITPWPNLNRYLGGMQSVITSSGDDQTVEELQKQLKNNDYRFTLTSFKAVQDAGKTGGFTDSNTQYIESLRKTDNALKVLLDAIDSRPNKDYEDWMVCVTSDHGGEANGDIGGASDSERDIFGVFYYPHYTSFEMKGNTFEAVRISKTEMARVKDSLAQYAIPRDRELAIEVVMRNTARKTGSYAGDNWNRILGKDKWGIARQRAKISLRTNDPTIEIPVENSYNDPLWHTTYMGFSAVVHNHKQYVIGLDGYIQRRTDSETLFGVEKDSTDFELGSTGLPTTFYVGALRMWNKQFDDVTIKETSNLLTIPDNKSYKVNLLGEWRFSPDEVVNDTVVPNRVKGMPPFLFDKKPVFVKVANTLPEMLESNNLVMENTLVLPQLIYWLLGSSAIDSRWEGYNFLKKYAIEEQWRDIGTDTATSEK